MVSVRGCELGSYGDRMVVCVLIMAPLNNLNSLCSDNHSQISTRIPNPYYTVVVCDRVTSQCLYYITGLHVLYPTFISKIANLRVIFPTNVLMLLSERSAVPKAVILTFCISMFRCTLSFISITTLNHDMQAIILPTMHHLIHKF